MISWKLKTECRWALQTESTWHGLITVPGCVMSRFGVPEFHTTNMKKLWITLLRRSKATCVPKAQDLTWRGEQTEYYKKILLFSALTQWPRLHSIQGHKATFLESLTTAIDAVASVSDGFTMSLFPWGRCKPLVCGLSVKCTQKLACCSLNKGSIKTWEMPQFGCSHWGIITWFVTNLHVSP